MTSEALDQEGRAERLSPRGMLGVLTTGHLAHDVDRPQDGLFDTMAGLPPSTSDGIAEAAG